MDFILNEAEVENDSVKFDSDDEDEMECDSTPLSEDGDFLTCYEDEYIEEDPSFYRTFDKREEFAKFENRTKNPVKSSKRSEKIIMVKMICLSCLHQRTEKKLTFIAFLTIKKEPQILKRALDVLFQSNKISFSMR